MEFFPKLKQSNNLFKGVVIFILFSLPTYSNICGKLLNVKAKDKFADAKKFNRKSSARYRKSHLMNLMGLHLERYSENYGPVVRRKTAELSVRFAFQNKEKNKLARKELKRIREIEIPEPKIWINKENRQPFSELFRNKFLVATKNGLHHKPSGILIRIIEDSIGNPVFVFSRKSVSIMNNIKIPEFVKEIKPTEENGLIEFINAPKNWMGIQKILLVLKNIIKVEYVSHVKKELAKLVKASVKEKAQEINGKDFSFSGINYNLYWNPFTLTYELKISLNNARIKDSKTSTVDESILFSFTYKFSTYGKIPTYYSEILYIPQRNPLTGEANKRNSPQKFSTNYKLRSHKGLSFFEIWRTHLSPRGKKGAKRVFNLLTNPELLQEASIENLIRESFLFDYLHNIEMSPFKGI